MGKKERLLRKYLEKKRKQRSRDELYAQIAALRRPPVEGDGARAKPAGRSCQKAGAVSSCSEESSESSEVSRCDRSEDVEGPHESDGETKREEESIAEEQMDGEEMMDNYWWDLHAKHVENGLGSGPSSPVDSPSEEEDASGSVLQDKGNSCATSSVAESVSKKYETVALENRREDIEEYRKTLPIYYEKAEVIHAVRTSPIVFICGAAGCGKTTQVPQFLYEGGLAGNGMIGITQPRRISAISICARINEETNESLCGYKIKYESTVTPETKIKVMTDGVLIREIQDDFLLSKYSVIIVDEVHERNANIDLLISTIPRIMRVRRERGSDLKLVLMSATGDIDELRAFLGEMTVFTCPEKRFHVSVFYEERTAVDYVDAAYERIRRIVLAGPGAGKRRRAGRERTDVIGSGVSNDSDASILVFLAGKQEIYQLKDRLERSGMDMTVLPLHSSLSKPEQRLVFDRTPSRKVILSTNIAETSITIPDVVFVIDSGKVKNKTVGSSGVARYSIDFVTKSSAIQRMGRAGRTGPGICYRLYSGEAYERFHESVEPQLLREPLDGVILSLLALGIRDVHSFPFLSKPRTKCINDAIVGLQSLGAVDKALRLTDIGKKMSKYPVEPRLARLLCIYGLEDVFVEVAAVVSLASSGIEIKRSHGAKRYFEGSKSDFLTQLAIYSDFLKSKTKRAFCTELGVGYTTMLETTKMMTYLLRIAGRDVDKDISLDLSPDACSRIRDIIYRGFVDHLAVPLSGSRFFRGDEVFASRDSVPVEDGDFVVFESLVSTKGKLYMRNVTVVDSAWF